MTLMLKAPGKKLYSLADICGAILNKNPHDACRDLRIVVERFSDLGQRLSQVSFSAKRHKPVNVAVRELALVIEIIMLLPGKTAAQVGTQAATILVRFLGGTLAFSKK